MPGKARRDATGHRGFFYHFLDMGSGRRAWDCELSTIDSAYLLAGALGAAAYFGGEERAERDIRETADALYRRCDFTWALNGGLLLSHGWRPEEGFLKRCWTGYSEALVLYLLALGSPTHPISPKSYAAFTSTYHFRKLYGIEYLHAGPLFIHQLSHVWVDFRGIHDAPMHARGLDYFENSARATRVQRLYAMRNPKRFAGYGLPDRVRLGPDAALPVPRARTEARGLQGRMAGLGSAWRRGTAPPPANAGLGRSEV